MRTSINAKSLVVLMFCCLVSFACKPRTYNAAVESSASHTVEKETLVYHWTNNRAALNPENYVFGELASVEKNNQNPNAITGTSVLGAGIYAAVNPHVSFQYGEYLVEIPVTGGTSFEFSRHRDVAKVQSAIPVLLYDFYLRMYSNYEIPVRSVVIRKPSVINFKGLKTYDGSKAIPIGEHKPLKAVTVRGVFEEYADQAGFVFAVIMSNLTLDEALAMAAVSEIQSNTARVIQAKKTAGLALAGSCQWGEEMPRYRNTPGNECAKSAASVLMRRHEISQLRGVFQALNFIDRNVNPDNQAVIKAVADFMRRDKQTLERVEELLNAVPTLRKELEDQYSLNNWYPR